jgi:hypothetical protein
VSGDTSGDLLYISTYYEEAPEVIEAIPFSGAGSYKIVFPSPAVCRSFRLVHSGDSAYQISRIIPRRAVQSFDLEVNAIKAYHVSAELIETIALEVSDSIVIGPDLIGDKTIGGDKIIDGTVSGVIITPGTITGNLIQAGTISGVLVAAGTLTADKIATRTITADQIAVSGITANELNVDKLSSIVSKTGSLEVSEAITVTSGEITAGLTRITQDGITVGNFTSNLPNVNRLNILGSGQVEDIVGMAFYNASFSQVVPLFSIQLDSINAVELNNNQSSGGLINFNFPDGSDNTSVQVFNGNLNILNGDFFVYNSTANQVVSSVDRTGAAEFNTVNNAGTLTTADLETSTLSVASGSFYADVGQVSVSPIIYFLSNAEAVAGSQFIVRDNSNYARVQASQTALTVRGSDNLLKFTVTTDNGNTRVYGDFRVDANFSQFNYGGMAKNTAQTVNAGVTAKITFQTASANGLLDDTTNNQINIVDAGYYVVMGGVVSTTVGLPWQVVTGGAYNSGIILNGVTQADGRAYVTKLLYLNAGGELELWLSNTGGTNAAISTGTNGAFLSAVKVG